MAIREYECPKHGRFESNQPITVVHPRLPCLVCGKLAPWVPSKPAGIYVEGGTT